MWKRLSSSSMTVLEDIGLEGPVASLRTLGRRAHRGRVLEPQRRTAQELLLSGCPRS